MNSTVFELRTVAHLMRPWGEPARNLEELRAGLAAAPDDVIFCHTVQYQVRSPGAEELAPDDLSAWTRGVLQDAETAERLSFAVLTQNASCAAVRAALLAALEKLPEKRRLERAAPEGSELQLLSAVSVSTPVMPGVTDAAGALDALIDSDPGVWFFHLLEEPWSLGIAPLADWLRQIGEERIAGWLIEAADAGLPIAKARGQLLRRWQRGQITRRLTDGATGTDSERREVARRAVARLMRKRPGSGS